jgi:small subunit ribosomal protein S20
VANIKSQIKRNRTNEQARLRNKATKSSLKTAVKKFRTAVESGDVDAATAALKDASRDLDKAASKGIIHRNQAANRKSAMGRSLSASASKPAAPAKATRATKKTAKAAKTA